MYVAGFSINVLTSSLLAVVLSVGLVVDDAIVMTEYVHPHQKGMKPFEAEIEGAKEIFLPLSLPPSHW